MGSKRQKMETAGMETPGISDLPVEITTEILTRLPIKDAVRTSLLSKHWRYQWMGMNKLLFVNTESDTTKGKNLVNFVNATLLVHKSRIHSFGYTNNFITSDINRWLIVLERHPLKELTLSLKSTNLTKFSMPSRIFFFHSLESFRVEYCRFPSTPPFGAFRSLHTLMLGNVDISQLAVETIVAGSPKLESLTLVSCTPFENLTIRAPKLTYFCMGGKYHSITLVGTTQITQLKLQLNVHLVNQVQTALYLLKKSPLLKSVDIHLSTAGNAQDPEGAALALNVWNSFLVKEDVLLRHLTKVNIKGFLGGPLELAAVEFFFKKASRLKQLSIKWTGRQHTDVIRQVGFFAWASPDAVLRF